MLAVVSCAVNNVVIVSVGHTRLPIVVRNCVVIGIFVVTAVILAIAIATRIVLHCRLGSPLRCRYRYGSHYHYGYIRRLGICKSIYLSLSPPAALKLFFVVALELDMNATSVT